jgi:hypothetical protein
LRGTEDNPNQSLPISSAHNFSDAAVAKAAVAMLTEATIASTTLVTA